VIPCRGGRTTAQHHAHHARHVSRQRRPALNDTTSAPNAGAIKPKLLDLLRQGQAELHAWLDDLTDAERTTPGTPDHWAPKDTLAHITFWIGAGATRLFDVKRREQPGFEIPGVIDSHWTGIADSDTGFQRYNDDTFAREHPRPWADVLADWRRASGLLLAGAEAVSEAQLIDTQAFPWLEGRPLWQSPLGNGFEHPLEHLAHFYRERGDLAHAQRLMERQTEGIFTLDPSDESRGGMYYNQGCFWALAGQPDRAIPLLREALTLRPDLVEWSRQDTDLVSLRDLPDFRAIDSATGA
jgi:tetratricopeptide (TPR) repeat protein